MDITVGELLFATKRLIELLPKLYLKDKLYEVTYINGDKINVKNETEESLFYQNTIGVYFEKSWENELWI